MALQGIAIKLVLVFAFVVFYFHYVQYVNQYPLIEHGATKYSVESGMSSRSINRANSQRQQRTQSQSHYLKMPFSFQSFLQSLSAYKEKISSYIKLPKFNNENGNEKSIKDTKAVVLYNNVNVEKLETKVVLDNKLSLQNQRQPRFEMTAKPTKKPTVSVVNEVKSNLRHNNNKDEKHSKFVKEKITEFAKPNEMIDNSTPGVGPDLTHPKRSPRDGTDISNEKARNEIIKCPGQSNCIVPALQLLKKFNVYLCKPPKHGGGVRFMYLVREGLITHPNINLMDKLNMEKVDYIVYLPGSGAWGKSECNVTHSVGKTKLVVLDEFDGPSPLYDPYPEFKDMVHYYGKNRRWYYMYFKRSFVYRHDGTFQKYPHFKAGADVYPLTYPLAEAYVRPNFNIIREIDILCTLRGSKAMSTRQRVQEWVKDYVDTNNITNAITKSVSYVMFLLYIFIFLSQLFIYIILSTTCLIYKVPFVNI